MGKRTNKPTLAIIRPVNGRGLIDGWTLALNTRHGINPLGEDAVAAFLALDKSKRTQAAEARIIKDSRGTPLAKATRQISDLPHLLAVGYELCVKHEFRPARAIRLFGDGARRMCKGIDAIRAKSAVLRKEATALAAKMIEGAKKGKVDSRVARAFQDATANSERYERETRKPAEATYRKNALAVLALFTSMADMRTAAADTDTDTATPKGKGTRKGTRKGK